METKITDPAMLKAILTYCRERRIPMWVVHTPPLSKIGGFSCELLSIDGATSKTRIANGDVRTVMTDEIHARGRL
ncbi:hypothetical protein [Actinoplanes sp. NPDC049265]|uniref:hypothetical protein n=1 Tax=Actinoplanes sp. NPDC049265 TaxID=3363902 RepID=UPI0037151621